MIMVDLPPHLPEKHRDDGLARRKVTRATAPTP
jgi:hypothetical protein